MAEHRHARLPGADRRPRCTVFFRHFTRGNLINIGPVKLGLFSRVTAQYLGAPGLAPSSGTGTIPVTLVVF